MILRLEVGQLFRDELEYAGLGEGAREWVQPTPAEPPSKKKTPVRTGWARYERLEEAVSWRAGEGKFRTIEWSNAECAQAGDTLLHLALLHSMLEEDGKGGLVLVGEIRAAYDELAEMLIFDDPLYAPSLVEPPPWTSWRTTYDDPPAFARHEAGGAADPPGGGVRQVGAHVPHRVLSRIQGQSLRAARRPAPAVPADPRGGARLRPALPGAGRLRGRRPDRHLCAAGLRAGRQRDHRSLRQGSDAARDRLRRHVRHHEGQADRHSRGDREIRRAARQGHRGAGADRQLDRQRAGRARHRGDLPSTKLAAAPRTKPNGYFRLCAGSDGWTIARLPRFCAT